MRSLPGYIHHTARKTYIDKYPSTIINLDDLKKGSLLEFGAGTGNDLVWLLQNGMLPNQICSLESDGGAFKILSSQLYEQLKIMIDDGMPLDKLYTKPKEVSQRFSTHDIALYWVFMHMPVDVRNSIYPATESFDYVYANNSLHCADNIDGINALLSRAYNHLKPNGVLFGRTLSDTIDIERLAKIKDSQDENHIFALDTVRALQEGRLIGLPPRELEQMAQVAGFSETYTESREHPWKPTIDFYFRLVK